MESLITRESPEMATFSDINQHVHQPFSHTQYRNLSDCGNNKTVDSRMGCEPPAPSECHPSARTLFLGHSIALETEISEEMAHGEYEEEVDRRW